MTKKSRSQTSLHGRRKAKPKGTGPPDAAGPVPPIPPERMKQSPQSILAEIIAALEVSRDGESLQILRLKQLHTLVSLVQEHEKAGRVPYVT